MVLHCSGKFLSRGIYKLIVNNQIGRVTRKFMEQGYHNAFANSIAMLDFLKEHTNRTGFSQDTIIFCGRHRYIRLLCERVPAFEDTLD